MTHNREPVADQPMTAYDRYINAGAEAVHTQRHWRVGQTAMNTLADLHPELADQIRGTHLDPSHLDARLPALLQHLREHLHVEGT